MLKGVNHFIQICILNIKPKWEEGTNKKVDTISQSEPNHGY